MTEAQKSKNQKKLIRAITKAGLSWSRYSSIIVIADEVNGVPMSELGLACWIYDPNTRQERVLIPNSTIERFDDTELILVIQHELLHKAMYRGLSGAKNSALVNLALDASIQKILFLGKEKRMIEFSKKVYPNREDITSICNCSITTIERMRIAKAIRKVFDEIYLCDRTYHTPAQTCADRVSSKTSINAKIPDPLTLYNKIASSFRQKDKKEAEDAFSALVGAGVHRTSSENDKDNNDKQKKSKSRAGSSDENEKEDEDNGENEDNGEDGSSEAQNTPIDGEDESSVGGGGEKQNDEGEPNTATQKPVIVRGGQEKYRASDKATLESEIEFTKDFMHYSGKRVGGWSYARNLNRLFDKYVVDPKSTSTKGLKAFIETLQTMRQVEGVEQCIYSDIASSVSFDPYPHMLTRTGFELVALGFSGPDGVPLYQNASEKLTAKKKICAYVDTSPSMNQAIPFVVHIIDFFDETEECEYAGGPSNGRYCFSEKVQGMTPEQWEHFRQRGLYFRGYGTNFSAVAQHVLNNLNEQEVDIVLIFTDGESTLTQDLIDALNATTIRVYPIYFQTYKSRRNQGIESPLDKLHGSSYTIQCAE